MRPIADILSDLLALDEMLSGSRPRAIPHGSGPAGSDGADGAAGRGEDGDSGQMADIRPFLDKLRHPWRADPVGWAYFVVTGRELNSAQRARWTAAYERHHWLPTLAREMACDTKSFSDSEVAVLLSAVASTPPAQWREAGPFAAFVAAYFRLNSRLPSIDEAERYLHGLLLAPQAPLGIARTVAEATSGIGRAFGEIERQLLAARPWPGFGRSKYILKPFSHIAIAHDIQFAQQIIGKEMLDAISIAFRLAQKIHGN